MKVAVTGAAGFIGSNLSDALVAAGHEVVGIDCFGSYPASRHERNVAALLGSPGFELHRADLTQADVAHLLSDVGAIFHLAGRGGVRDSWGAGFDDYVTANVIATQRVAEAAVAAGVPRVVYASSSSVYGELGSRNAARESDAVRPHSPYGVTKHAAERLLLAYQDNHGLEVVAFRYFTIYGPRQRPDMAIQRFIERALQDRPIEIYGDGSQERDVTFVDDCVRATMAGLSLPPDVYNVAGGSVVTLNRILDVLDQTMPSPLLRTYSEVKPGDVKRTVADTSKLRAAGVSCGVSLEEGIRRQVEYVLARSA